MTLMAPVLGAGKQHRGPAWEAAGGRCRQHHREGCSCCHGCNRSITQPPGHSPFLDPPRTVHIDLKTELGKVRVIFFKTSSLSILYTKRSVYLEVTLKEP